MGSSTMKKLILSLVIAAFTAVPGLIAGENCDKTAAASDQKKAACAVQAKAECATKAKAACSAEAKAACDKSGKTAKIQCSKTLKRIAHAVKGGTFLVTL